MSERRAKLVAQEQFRLQSIIRLALADVIDTIERESSRSGLTWQEANTVILNVGGVPPAVCEWLSRKYLDNWELLHPKEKEN